MLSADVSDLQRYTDSVLGLGREAGAPFVSVAPPDVMVRARKAIVERKSAGLSDTMEFTFRNPERSTDPSRTVMGARAVIVAALPCGSDTPQSPHGPHGMVAQYARQDHYGRLSGVLRVMRDKLREDGFKALDFVDDNSMVDREIAWMGGLGWFGKNANLLIRGAGSMFVLGSVVTTAPLKVRREVEPDGCGACRVCIDACPTNAIVGDGVLDARRCLSWLLQRPGVFPLEHRIALGDRLYGCDDCQETCPENVRLAVTRRIATRDETWVPILDVLQQDDRSLAERVGRWYVPGRDMNVVRRNALIVLGNVGDASSEIVRRTIARYLVHDDEVLRAHAVWSARRLGLVDLLPATDSSELVMDELRRVHL
ncbi:MAG: tRNA epoxyqueuosine(34) reductase QueG [Ilumatobacteraceae bacterium]